MPWTLKSRASQALLSIGLDVRFKKRNPLYLLRSFGVRTVLDIGANEGQFAAEVRAILPDARIFSFEPLPQPFAKLIRSRAADRNFEAIQMALGLEEGEADFHVNEFSPSSSMLRITQKTTDALPFTARTTRSTVRVATLDAWAAGRELSFPLFVKMDVQGFEDRVIRGGRDTISRASIVMAEVSFTELYQGQPMFEDILDLMRSLQFRCAGMIGGFDDPKTGEILQMDALFTRIDQRSAVTDAA